ncbi:2-hydroxyacid dehydrogenase [Desulfocicer vacuolatum]|nr:D-glycerate dehydrogenase [Desulfocicer vacuolatum]
MKGKKILITRNFPDAGIKMLEEQGFCITLWDSKIPMTQPELIEKAKKHNAVFCTMTEKIDAHFLNECRHLEIISQFAVGYDNIDISEATRRGIPVGYTPNAMNQATADIAFGLMIATARKMFYTHNTISKDQWKTFQPKAFLGMELMNKTLGIVGMGRIGMEMAKRCRGAYDMEILYHNRSPNPVAQERFNARLTGFDQLLAKSDIVSVHCALTPETREMFNRAAFEKMKSSAIFINTARGMVHNETDLIHALETGQIWGAGLDVTNPEPMDKDNSLLSMENVCVLPHIGSATVESRNTMSIMAATNIIEFYRNGTMPTVVNPEVLKGL